MFDSPPSILELGRNQVHVWSAFLDVPEAEYQKQLGTLSPDERRRAERFVFERDRRRFVACRGILRTILGRYLNVSANSLRFNYGKNGKPVLADAYVKGPIRFNLSHSEKRALFVFTQNSEIGVDIEYLRDISEMEPIVERFFSIQEKEGFRSLPKSEKRETFFNIWTRKEAFAKALGEGLSQSLDKFDVSLVPGEPAKLLSVEGDSREASQWSIQDVKPASDYAGAFAVKSDRFETECWLWEAT